MGKSLRMTIVALAAFTLVATACGSDDDGARVRNLNCNGSGSASGGSASASGSASGGSSGSVCSGSGSGSGLSASDLGKSADSAVLKTAVKNYTEYVKTQTDATIAATKTLTDAVRAGDVAAAKAAFAPSREGWEAIEPIAGLVEEIDGATDARVDDFEGVDDPKFTGWHRIENELWAKNNATAAVPFADKLDADLQTLKSEIPKVEITPLAMARGAADLVEEVSEGKITGEEDRYSHTDLWDFAANIAGAKMVITLLAPALDPVDPDLLADITKDFTTVETGLAKYKTADGGYQDFSALTAADSTQLKADLAALSEKLALVPGALGLK